MKSKLVIVLIAGVLTACAAPPPPAPPKPPAVLNTQTPKCSSRVQCEAMWIDAQNVLSSVSGMKLRLATDSRLETFGPTGFGRMGGVVTKYPVAESTYEFRVEFYCYGRSGCDDLPIMATNLFNTRLGASEIANRQR